MTEPLSRDTQAVLLLCGRFAAREQAHPLDLREYNRVIDLLQKQSLRPGSLLEGAARDLDWSGSGIEPSRLQSLLQRGMALGLAVEHWINSGLWIFSRSDDHYPSRLRQHLGRSAPALLWGVGDRRLLARGGVAIVGSRDVDEADVEWTAEIAAACAAADITVISGGARGSDQVAMAAALAANGTTIGVVAEGLGKPAAVARHREAIVDGRLVLISPYYPDAGFNVGNAMGRNKLIYGLAEAALIVRSELRTGGTWAGAEEELRRENAIPLFVRAEDGMPEGNRALVSLGAREAPRRPWSAIREWIPGAADVSSESLSLVRDLPVTPSHGSHTKPSTDDAIITRILAVLDVPRTSNEIATLLGMETATLNPNLKVAVDEKAIDKLMKPVRYARPQPEASGPRQPGLFDRQ